MSVESAPTTQAETVDTEYVKAAQNQILESEILNRGEDFGQGHVETLLSQTALNVVVESSPAEHIEVTVEPSSSDIESSPSAADVLAELTISDEEAAEEAARADAAIAEAKRRQAEMAYLNRKQDLQQRAAREDWPEGKYEAELEKIEVSQ